LECISTVEADLQNGTVKAEIGIHLRSFKIEVVPEGELLQSCREHFPVETFVAHYGRIIDKDGVRECVSRRPRYAGI
jgi:hypothetical protein